MRRRARLRVVPERAPPPAQTMTAGTRRRLVRDPRGWLATGFGVGFVPRVPGSAASVLAVLPWWFWLSDLPLADQLGIVALAFLLGLWAARWTIRESGLQDPPVLVWDEVVGVWLALSVLPREWPWVLAALLLFRLLDIAKPGPIGWVDRRFKGAFGTMADDLLAGALTAVVLALVLALLPPLRALLGG